MCQEMHLSDVRLALLDYCDNEEDEHLGVDDLLGEFEAAPPEDEFDAHAIDHARRAQRLAARGEDDAASIHKALLANMARAAS